jgi:hypothetical protein
MSAIESEGTRLAIILAVTVWPFSSSSILFASRTKSIFHWGKVGLRGAFMAASTDSARVDGLEPMRMLMTRNRRQAIFLR